MSFIRLEPRGQASKTMVYATPLLAVALTLLSGFILFLAMGFDPLKALYSFFVAPVTSVRGLGELVVKATPLVLCAVGLAIGFRANVWNIGAEGQLTLGAITGGGLALAFYGEGGWWLLPLMVIGGAIGGAVWAAVPAYLRLRFNASEILTSLMLNYVALLLLNYLVHGPYRDPDGFAFPESRLFEADAVLPILWSGTRVHLGALFALAAVAGGWLLIARTFIGFQIKVIGLTPAAAGYAGFDQKRIVWLTLLLSGALAGIAGMGEIAGPIGQVTASISPGYGYTAIIVAFLGRLHPVGILLAALLMALSFIGGEAAQIAMGLPKAITGVFQGMLLFFLLASDVLIRYRVRFGVRRAAA
ncbi:simple sugar transport system permease protein [Azospirillum lipoferum]|uniref:ABC transporter permease n=1 Tax=Azospirillum lipoferum TaxID=193 RepID=A0A5A9GXX3_AZOLI|nr:MULTISPECIES: ABC transporter permease [Azospirillum]KAA0598329.1 ABC transporter permease [Azospirillum lipoferum]MCP1609686.1 simple sugar transport system permease protein [Azospirillum lipoferum]MDW5535009.1 ABC transporter permease [Azospirillum sp. NL1]